VFTVKYELRQKRHLSNDHLIIHRKRALCYTVSEVEETTEHEQYNAKRYKQMAAF
jgi:hypothetical protein